MNPRAIALAEMLIRKFEGCRLTAYQDVTGRYTIGWGNTAYANGEPVHEGDCITADQAETLLTHTLGPLSDQVTKLLPANATNGQSGALLDFAWNLGLGALKGSTLLRVYREGDLLRACAEFGAWVYAAGRVQPGLVERRRAERTMFCGIGVDPAPAPVLAPADDARVTADELNAREMTALNQETTT